MGSTHPHAALGAELLPGPVWFWSGSVREGVQVQTLGSEGTGASTLVEVLTGLLTAGHRKTSEQQDTPRDKTGPGPGPAPAPGLGSAPDSGLEEIDEVVFVSLVLHPVD